jgi:hypothetical protein
MTTGRPGNKRGWGMFLLGCAVGGVVGFGAGVASVKAVREIFLSAFQDERSAEVDQPQLVDRPAFRLQYPQNWKVDTADTSYDPDRMFSIDSPGTSFVLFSILTGEIDPQLALDAQVNQHQKVIHDATRTPFERWGAYPGKGMLLTGKKLDISPGTVRIFAFRVGERTFTVVESTSDDDRSKVAPGFALVERSFRVKEAR